MKILTEEHFPRETASIVRMPIEFQIADQPKAMQVWEKDTPSRRTPPTRRIPQGKEAVTWSRAAGFVQGNQEPNFGLQMNVYMW